jgi:hypothetical protein
MFPVILALAIIAIIFIVILAGIPDEFAVSRSTKISAPPEKIFPYVNDLHKWDAWSPWAKIDPNAKNSFEGAPAGPGAMMSWDGNKKIGAGRMTVVESRPSDFVRLKIEFIRPFAATNAAEFRFQPEGSQTNVNWTMTGKNSTFFKIFGMFFSCGDMVGRDFEKGLASLKSVAEK